MKNAIELARGIKDLQLRGNLKGKIQVHIPREDYGRFMADTFQSLQSLGLDVRSAQTPNGEVELYGVLFKPIPLTHGERE